MRNLIRVILIFGISVFLSGCFETKEEYTLNPDGSGKVVYSAAFPPMSFKLGDEEPDPESQMKDAVKDILEKSSGIDVWKDVSYKLADDGKISFKGTAYFKDVSKFDVHNQGMMKVVFFKDEKGNLVLELKGKEKDKKGVKTGKKKLAKLSEEEITKKFKEEKAKYQQMKPMMSAFMSTMKQEMRFHLPGKPSNVTNFKVEEGGTLLLTFEGEKLFGVMDEMFEDPAWMRKQILAGADFTEGGPKMDLMMNEKLFGEKAPVRATVTGAVKPLFNYKAEVTAAKKDSPKLFKELGAAAPIPVASAKGGNFKNLKVGGVRVVTVSDGKRDVRPFNYDAGYTISLIGELPGAVLKVTEGKLEKAIADNGDSLLPEREWNRKIHFPHLSKDKTTVVFEVKLTLPGENVKGLKEISGMLEYTVAGGSREVPLGITDFTAGAKGNEFGAVVKSVKESEWQKEKEVLALKLNLSSDSVKSMTFYDGSKKKLDVSESGHGGFGNSTTFQYTCEGKFPAKGSIVVEIFEKLEKYNIPFKIENISLMGQPL